jgi:hypothetical protein
MASSNTKRVRIIAMLFQMKTVDDYTSTRAFPSLTKTPSTLWYT